MLAYLSKKITVPNNTKLQCVAWNNVDDFIACGGVDGFLKVLKLEPQKVPDEPAKLRGIEAPLSLTHNQTLEGHSGRVDIVKWNDPHQRLATCDEKGLIIVWMLYKGCWYEEMINNRDKSVVTGMGWSKDGNKICIVYQDGSVVVGHIEGHRLWGKEIEDLNPCAVEWSPDGAGLLFGLDSGEVHYYDSSGNFKSKLKFACLDNHRIKTIAWFDDTSGHIEPNSPCLVVCCQTGEQSIQIFRNEKDEYPIIIKSLLTVTEAAWNHTGSVLAVAGSYQETCMVEFYSPLGQHFRTLKVPGKDLRSCAWDGSGLKLVMAVDSFLYFAYIRQDYKWAYSSDSIIYSFKKQGETVEGTIFWNTKAGEKPHILLSNKKIFSISAIGDHCCLATTTTEKAQGQCQLMLRHSGGVLLADKSISMSPLFVTMSETCVVAASKQGLYTWMFQKKSGATERILHIDDDAKNGVKPKDNVDFKKINKETKDPICCICVSKNLLIVGRELGMVKCYTLPELAFKQAFGLEHTPYRLFINCDASRLAIIDAEGFLELRDLDRGKWVHCRFRRRDVWSFHWAQDSPEMYSFMQTSKLTIYSGENQEVHTPGSGYICGLNRETVKVVMLDELMKNPENPSPEFFQELDIKTLKILSNSDKAEEEIHDTPESSEVVDKTVPEAVAKLSVQDTFPEATENLCSACQHKGVEREATHSCVECEELLCDLCKDLHKSFKQFRDHKFVPVKSTKRK